MAQGICEGLWMKIILDDLKVKGEIERNQFDKEVVSAKTKSSRPTLSRLEEVIPAEDRCALAG
ncbi:hypothetical protein CR513_29073, partial [Mucuna pruriens]